MRHRTFRVRRAALTLMLGASVAGGTIASGVVAGPAQAATPPTVGSMSTSSAPAINTTGSNQAASPITVTMPTTAVGSTEYVDLLVTANASGPVGSSTICFHTTPTVSSNGVLVQTTSVVNQAGVTCPTGAAGDIVQVAVPAQAAPTSPGTITISGISYDTASATGTLQVYGWIDSAASDTTNPPATQTGLLSPTTGLANATLPPAPPGAPASLGITAATSPAVGVGLANQPAGNLQVTLDAGATTQGWQQGYIVAVTVAPNSGANCNANTYIGFASVGTPTVSTTAWATTATVPTVTASRAYITPCGSAVANQLLLTFGNSGTFPQSTSTFTITVPGVQYTSGSTTPTGAVQISGVYENSSGVAQATPAFGPSAGTAPGGPSDAVVSTVVVTANSPAVNVDAGAINSPISPITVTEASAGAVTAGWVCVTLANTGATSFAPSSSAGTGGTNAFDQASTPTVTVSSGPGTVASTASFETVGTGGTTDNTVAFDVTTPLPESAPSAYQISGLGVDAGGTAAGSVLAQVTTGVSSASLCPSTAQATSSTVTAYGVVVSGNRIYGPNADATAAAELETAYNFQGTSCPGSGGSNGITVSENRPVVMATDTGYADALAGSYLAGDLQTGELLTGINSLPATTLQALRLEGISQVYIVGGPYVVSNAVVTQLQNTPVYLCGGQQQVTTLLGTAQDISVTRIYGQTEYDTAAQIAQFPGASHVKSMSFTGAYAGTNSSSGNGMYNDTSGTASVAAATSSAVPTAILATGQGFQDAMSASVLSYSGSIPILLTTPGSLSTQAQAELQALGIQQVIVMGGPIAVSNAVVSSLQGLGMSVLRVAGQDYTDTAVQLAKFEMNTPTGGLGLGWASQGDLFVARGDYFTDGLAGAIDAASNSTSSASANSHCIGSPGTCADTPVPLLLTKDPNTVGSALTSFLNQAGSATGVDNLTPAATIGAINILGGPLAITPATATAMTAALTAG